MVRGEDRKLNVASKEVLKNEPLFKKGVCTLDRDPTVDTQKRAMFVLCFLGGGFDKLDMRGFGHAVWRLAYCMDRLLYPSKDITGYLGCQRYLPEKGPPGLYMAFKTLDDANKFLMALDIWRPHVSPSHLEVKCR